MSPQWLVKMLAYVIVAHPFRKFGSTLDKQYECLIKLGIHHKELFDYMVKRFNNWQESSRRGISIDSKQAMDFVEKFNFVAEIDRNIIFLNDMKRYQSLGKPNNKLYIVPSMLPEEIPEMRHLLCLCTVIYMCLVDINRSITSKNNELSTTG